MERDTRPAIGVIGQGFVGGSLTTVFLERGFNVYTYDKAGVYVPGSHWRQGAAPWSVEHLVNALSYKRASPVVFVCVPTPMRRSGEADLSIVESVLDELSEASESVDRDLIAVIKSTVPPGSTERWNEKYAGTKLTVVFSPEFLMEVSALEDMRTQSRIIVGGPRPASTIVKNTFRRAFPEVKIIKTSSTIAETVKYFTNSLLATKVSWANEMYQICEGLGIDYDKVVEYGLHDPRLGKTHLSVPGPDGHFGFGGHCFPKDLNALMFLARQLGVKTTVMQGVWDKNAEVRDDRDWERQVGRAVSED